MKLIDISKELFTADVYPGDTIPQKEKLSSLDGVNPAPCQLTKLTVGSHNGTHMDAPLHFCKGGKDIAQVDLEKCIGTCKVVHASGKITKDQVNDWLLDGTKRLLIQGKIEITMEAARAMTEHQLKCIGVEGLTVGPMDAPMAVHLELLGHEMVILENLNLQDAMEGQYFLMAQPLKMSDLDGSPVRAVLMQDWY